MSRATSNKSLPTKRPIPALRKASAASGETDDENRAPGASGKTSAHRRPGRAAALQTIAATKRSERWRNPEKGGPARRRGNLAKGSRTGSKRS